MNAIKTLSILMLLLSSCFNKKEQTHKSTAKTEAARPTSTDKIKLPFIGARYFETRPLASGKATLHRKVEIKANGTVEFVFEQESMADGAITRESYNSGTFKKVMKCVFKEWDNETRFYEITPNRIYETDSAGTRLKMEDCCNLSDTLAYDCLCVSEYFKEQSW